MTNEEAISVIENEIQIDVRLCTGEQVDRFQTALYMAISALRAEPTGDALTLEQLRKMDRQPVWVKVIGKTGISCDGWCEVGIRDKDPFAYVWWPGSEVEDIAKIEDYGKTWACYAYQPAHIDREAWVSVEDRMPKYNIREDGELVSSKILVRCEIDKTVHLVVSKKFYTGRPGEMVHPVFRFYDEWGDIIENVSHWMPLPEPAGRAGEEDGGEVVGENRFVKAAKHAIGLGNRKPYIRHGKLFYRPYRNYFATTVKSPDYELWVEMVDAGYAAFSQDGYRAFFWLKRSGLNWLGEKLGMHIYDEED